MQIIIQFVHPILKEKIMLNLRNVKKITPNLKQYMPKITDENFQLLDEESKKVVEFDVFFVEETHAVSFENFKGKLNEDVRKMLMFQLVEMIGEKAFVFEKQKKIKFYFGLDNFFLIEKGKYFKLGMDYEKLIETELYHVPLEARE